MLKVSGNLQLLILSLMFTVFLSGCAGESDVGGSITDDDSIRWTRPDGNTDGSQLNDLTGYIIYIGATRESLTHSFTIDDPTLTSYRVGDIVASVRLNPGTTYYFAIIAINSRNLGSSLSNILGLRYY